MARTLTGRPLVPGQAEGAAVVTDRPLSFWGGLSVATGEIIDRRHPLSGEIVTGKVLVLPAEKGSSTASAILLDAIRAGTAPAAILTGRTAPILALGAIVADEMYGRTVPVVLLDPADLATIQPGDHVTVRPDGTVVVEADSAPPSGRQ